MKTAETITDAPKAPKTRTSESPPSTKKVAKSAQPERIDSQFEKARRQKGDRGSPLIKFTIASLGNWRSIRFQSDLGRSGPVAELY